MAGSEATTLLPTPDGWRTITELRAGDELFDEAGNVCKVLVADPWETPEQCYRLFFDDGSHLDASSEHQWPTFNERERVALLRRTPEFRERRRKTRSSRVTGNKSALFTERIIARNKANPPSTRPAPTWTLRSTGEIFKALEGHDGRPNHAIPLAKALNIPHCDLPIDPYTLGAWLGDGNSNGGAITVADEEIIEKIERNGAIAHKVPSSQLLYRVKDLTKLLRLNNLQHNKHIPQQYLRSSFEQRLELLKGLMDTDGTVDKDGHMLFYNTNKALIEDTLELTSSLGLKARVNRKPAKFKGRNYGSFCEITFLAPFHVFHLARKRENQKLTPNSTSNRARFRYIVDCQPIDAMPMRFFAVSSPSSLCLAGKSFVPMHNSPPLPPIFH